jgi:hypothetical protein
MPADLQLLNLFYRYAGKPVGPLALAEVDRLIASREFPGREDSRET